MAATPAAVNCGSNHTEARITGSSNSSLERRPEARPPGAAIVLCGRGEQVAVAARASEFARTLFVKQRARKRKLGRTRAQHGKLIRGQELAPFSIRVRDLEGLTSCRRDPPARDRCSCNPDSRADQKATPRDHGPVLPIPSSSLVRSHCIATAMLTDTPYCAGIEHLTYI
jgi:hypothetical protein